MRYIDPIRRPAAMAAAAMLGYMAMLSDAQAQSHGFEGIWRPIGGGCTASGDYVPITITATEIRFYESACQISDVRTVAPGGEVWTVEATCTGEGYEWRTPYVIARHTAGRDIYLSMIDVAEGHARLMQPCP